MNDDTFEKLVKAEMRGSISDEQMMFLRDPETLQRWYDQLVDFKRSVEYQFTDRKADLKAFQQECLAKGLAGKAEYFKEEALYRDWAASANGYKRAVEKKISEVKRLLREQNAKENKSKDRLFRDQLCLLCHQAAAFVPREHVDWHEAYQRLFRKEKLC